MINKFVKMCENCKYYENHKCKIFSLTNIHQACEHWEGILIVKEDKQLNFARGNVIKYVSRAGKKAKNKELEDLKKGRWYLNREIERLEKEK